MFIERRTKLSPASKSKARGFKCLALLFLSLFASFPLLILGTGQQGWSELQQQARTTERCAGESSWAPSSSAHTAADQPQTQTVNKDSASSASQGRIRERKKAWFFDIPHQINALFSRYFIQPKPRPTRNSVVTRFLPELADTNQVTSFHRGFGGERRTSQKASQSTDLG